MICLLAHAKDEPLFRPSTSENYENCPAQFEYLDTNGQTKCVRGLTVKEAMTRANSMFNTKRSNHVTVWALDAYGNPLRKNNTRTLYATASMAAIEPVLSRKRFGV